MGILILVCMNGLIFESFMDDLLNSAIAHEDLESLANVTALGGSGTASMEAMSKASQTVDIFKYIRDPEIRTGILRIAATIATFEVVWMIGYSALAVSELYNFSYAKTEYKSYQQITNLFQGTLPTMGTF